MRNDMAKVVTEKPRRGHGNSSMKTARRLSKGDFDADDHGPMRHAVSRNRQYADPKTFSDLLGPLRRYLRKQVGRPWNAVYSDLSAALDKRSLTGLHIWDHIRQEVEQRCELGAGGRVLCYQAAARYRGGEPVWGLYVHPMNGLLCYRQQRRIQLLGREAYELATQLEPFGLAATFEQGRRQVADWKILDDLHVLQRVRGLWMLHVFEVLNPDEVIEVKTVGGREYPIRRRDMLRTTRLRRVSTRQIGRREKKLWNVK